MNRKGKHVLDDLKTFLIFCGPTTFVFIAVIIVPFIFGIYLTFTNWDGISKAYSAAGFENYKMVFQDKEFWKSLLLTLRYVLFTVLFTNFIAFFLAYALTSGIRGQNLLRAGFFTPNLVGGVILGLIWNFVFSNILTFIGKTYGVDLLISSWLGKPNTAFWALVLVTVWQYSGYMMVIYIAGFMNVPKEVLEAASIDGVRGIKRFLHIILPLMIPSFIICIFLTLQRSFMVYDVNLSLTKGGPFKSTQLISMHVYEKAFLAQKYGIGQAEAFILFILIAVITVTQIYFGKKMEVEA
ncbi:MAG: sugar ABC transporter permease [Clostridia bacterium]|nr:sugar ABC transporter permease [Clostridia bacterium]